MLNPSALLKHPVQVSDERADVHARWMAAMRRGDFEEAWRQTDRIELPRRQLERAGTFVWQPHHLIWNGQQFSGRHVWIRCNHGLGDTLQFLRFVPFVARVARQVTILTQPPLLSLLSEHPGLGDVRNGWNDEPEPDDCVQVEIMELPYAFRVTRDSLPQTVPYLDHARVEARAKPLPLPEHPGALKVGLLWAASEWDRSRSVPFSELEPLSEIQGVRFYNLQQGPSAADARGSCLDLVPLSRHTSEIVDAAAALLRLDLLITVDSMVAHLAGALGRPVWLLLLQDADWRWMEQLENSHWYPSMRLFRQRANGWRGVVEDVATALRQYRTSVRARPISRTT